MTWVRAGRTGVDTGSILITDPCYVVRDTGEVPMRPFQNYGQLMDVVVGDQPAYQLTNQFGADIGVYVTHFGGDGVFDVWLDMDDRGLVRAAQIRFDGQEP